MVEALTTTSAVPIFPARLRLPPRRPGLIGRPRLVGRLRATTTPIVSIVAPAGYGKTTLLSEWADRDERPFSAVVLDRHLAGSSPFLTYLVHALANVVTLDPRALTWLETPSALQRRMVTSALATAVAEAREPFVLVLDDVHLLTREETVETVLALVEHLPPGAQVVLASRGAPALPMATLRAHDEVTDFGPDDLRMSVLEVRETLRVNGARVSTSEARVVADKTEGWPAAVYLAGRAARDGFDPTALTGRDETVIDYLRTEFLEGQPEHLRRFLRRAAVLDELCGPLCDAALEMKASSRLLDEMERSNLLLVPLDRERQWYRFHHLLGEALRLECEHQEPQLLRAIRDRASRWFEDHGRIERAIEYAQAAENAPRVRELVTRNAMRLFATGRDDALRSWFEWLTSRGYVDETVAVMCAWLQLLNGHGADAERLVTLAEAGDSEVLLPEGSPVAAWTHALRGSMALDVPTVRSEAAESLRLLSPRSPLRATAVVELGFADYLEGQLERADRQLADAAELAVALGASGAAILATAVRASIAVLGNRWDLARSLVTEGTSLVDKTHLGGYVGVCLLHAVHARVSLHMNDVGRAKVALQDAEQLTPFLAPRLVLLSVVVRVELARAYLELDDLSQAESHVEGLEDICRFAPQLSFASESVDSLRSLLATAHDRVISASSLSPAELRVLPWLATQFSMREIADHLFVSVHTVKAQVTSIYRKLGVTSRSQAVEQARAQGLLND